MSSRGGKFRHQAVLVAAVVLVCFASTAEAAGPPDVLFKKGYNLCRAASLKAVRKAGGQPYRAGLFANQVCTWERPDLQAGLTLSTHPPSAGAALMRSFLTQNGKNGIKAKLVRVPGATNAVLATLRSQSDQVSRYLFAAYPHGTIQVNMNAPDSLPQGRLVAVMRLVAR